MSKTVQGWVKPALVRLGKIADVAGANTINNNGPTINVKS